MAPIAMVEGQSKVEAAFQTGQGVAWGESCGCLFCAVGAFFRPGYVNSIVQSWLPSLDGVLPKLKDGAKVADIGCGVGFSTLLMARAFPSSSFVGYDFHAPSIEQANSHVAARSREACDEAKTHRIVPDEEDNGDRLGCGLGRECRRRTCGGDHSNVAASQIGCQLRQPVILILGEAVYNRHVLTLNVAALF